MFYFQPGVTKSLYVTPNDKLTVTINKNGKNFICTMHSPKGINQAYVDKGIVFEQVPISHTINLGNCNFADAMSQMPQIVANMTGFLVMQNFNIHISTENGKRYKYNI